MFEISDKILKGTNVTIEDIEGNETHFVSFFSDLKNNQFFGKDIKINFNKIYLVINKMTRGFMVMLSKEITMKQYFPREYLLPAKKRWVPSLANKG